jgi:hypothetical protein
VNLWARSRTVEIPEVGALVFREPTLADVTKAQTDPYWWVATVTFPDGKPFLEDAQDAGKIRADLAALLLAEVNRPHPTAPPSGGFGESPTTTNG